MFTELVLCMLLTCIAPHPVYQPQILEQKVGYKPYQEVVNENELKCLTDNIYYEAGIEKDIGKKAVALVTMNRLKSNEYANTICKVVHQRDKYRCQFSWTCFKKRQKIDVFVYARCRKIAKEVMINYEVMHDVTKGATYFHRYDIRPPWAIKTKLTVVIGKHKFYKI